MDIIAERAIVAIPLRNPVWDLIIIPVLQIVFHDQVMKSRSRQDKIYPRMPRQHHLLRPKVTGKMHN
jgi:hypothetical protein